MRNYGNLLLQTKTNLLKIIDLVKVLRAVPEIHGFWKVALFFWNKKVDVWVSDFPRFFGRISPISLGRGRCIEGAKFQKLAFLFLKFWRERNARYKTSNISFETKKWKKTLPEIFRARPAFLLVRWFEGRRRIGDVAGESTSGQIFLDLEKYGHNLGDHVPSVGRPTWGLG